MKILRKKKKKKKYGFSPDGGDAVALAFAMENFFMKNKFFDKNNNIENIYNNKKNIEEKIKSLNDIK